MNKETSNGLGAATLFGIPVSIFIWDGTKPSLTEIGQKHQAHVVGDVLHFRGKRGNASICKGGWMLFFAGEISDFGYEMPDEKGKRRP
jgi:hypothetical protein